MAVLQGPACPVCGEGFMTVRAVRDHAYRDHGSGKPPEPSGTGLPSDGAKYLHLDGRLCVWSEAAMEWTDPDQLTCTRAHHTH